MEFHHLSQEIIDMETYLDEKAGKKTNLAIASRLYIVQPGRSRGQMKKSQNDENCAANM